MIRLLVFYTTLLLSSTVFAEEQTKLNKNSDQSESDVVLFHNQKIDAALASGGEPVVVEVLGAVCDFCAQAMNRTFSRKNEVAAVYVDLDTKTLNLVLISKNALSDDQIDRLVVRSGYKTKSIQRGPGVLGGSDARPAS